MTDLKIIEIDIKKLEKKYETKKAAAKKANELKSEAWSELKSKKTELTKEKKRLYNLEQMVKRENATKNRLEANKKRMRTNEEYALAYQGIASKAEKLENDPEAKEVYRNGIYKMLNSVVVENLEFEYSEFGNNNLELIKIIAEPHKIRILFLRLNNFTYRELGILFSVTSNRIRQIFKDIEHKIINPRVSRKIIRGTLRDDWV